ncbi:MAG: cell cycle transcriptional regulator TrcR, partial [Pseudomonadota bacterium]
METRPLMPKATAVWLIDNTALTFDQIAAFCGLHMLEVEGLADGEVNPGMQGINPIIAGHLTQAELDRCQADPSSELKLSTPDIPLPAAR